MSASPGAPTRAEHIRESWERNAAPWTDAVRGGLIPSRRSATDRAIVEAVSALGARRVLDVGCGEGWLSHTLAERAVTVTGIDGSEALVRAARAAGGGTFHHCSYATLSHAPLAYGRFDAAVCNFSLFEQSIAAVLSALHALLQEHGTLLIQTVHPVDDDERDGWREERFEALHALAFEPMPWFFRTTVSWQRALRQAGFARVDAAPVVSPETSQPLSLLLHARRAG